jgi:hypothetical protein
MDRPAESCAVWVCLRSMRFDIPTTLFDQCSALSPTSWFLLICGQFTEFCGKWECFWHSLSLETLRIVFLRKPYKNQPSSQNLDSYQLLVNEECFMGNGHQIRTRRFWKPLHYYFHHHRVEIQRFLSRWIPIGLKSTNRISGEWAPDSDSTTWKTYSHLSSAWSWSAVQWNSYSDECCHPIGQFHTLPAASVGFVFLSNKVDVDLPLDIEIICGKFRCIRSNGVGMHSEQTNKQTNKQTYKHSSLYI